MSNRLFHFNHGWKHLPHDCDGKDFDRVDFDSYKEPQWLKAGNLGLAVPHYDDSAWEDVTLPHDFLIEKCDFTAEEVASVGSLRKGVCWYRKTFTLPEETADKRVFIRFDGVYRNSQVWCNGNFMGRHLGGYLGFSYELTEVLYRDRANTIAVFVDGTGYEGWWYEGGGIYRDAFLVATAPVRVQENGVFVKPHHIDINAKTSEIDVEITFDSNKFADATCTYQVAICDPAGKQVLDFEATCTAESLATTTVKHSFSLAEVALWDLDAPNLYTATITVHCEGETDQVEETFGVRHLVYNAQEGMKLNGKSVFMRGACGHDDFAGVGTALTRSTLQFKVDKLKEMGCNAYRCSHNPPSPLLLEICDQCGMIVIDETRLPGTSREMLEDYTDLIKRDRNHPCVFFFSMANEEMVIQRTQTGVNIFNKMHAVGKKLDDSRDYLFAINDDKPGIVNFMEDNGLNLPVHGVNYLTNRTVPQLDIVHQDHPDICFISTETTGMASIRGYILDTPEMPELSNVGKLNGVWYNPAHEGRLTCYGDFTPVWSFNHERAFQEHENYPHMLGAFMWTGFDYRGEVFPYEFPSVISCYGVIDLCGFFKDWAYYVQAWWTDKPVLHIFPSWNLPLAEGEPVSVWAFSNCEEVELFINGVSQGKQSVPHLGHLEWAATYEKGTVTAIGYRDGKVVMEESICSSEAEYRLVLSTEKASLTADGNDSTVVVVEAVDKDGRYVTDSTIQVHFALAGDGCIRGVGNGDSRSLEHDKLPQRKLYAGKAMAIIEAGFSTGGLTLTASADGVESASITLSATALADYDNYIFSVTVDPESAEIQSCNPWEVAQ